MNNILKDLSARNDVLENKSEEVLTMQKEFTKDLNEMFASFIQNLQWIIAGVIADDPKSALDQFKVIPYALVSDKEKEGVYNLGLSIDIKNFPSICKVKIDSNNMDHVNTMEFADETFQLIFGVTPAAAKVRLDEISAAIQETFGDSHEFDSLPKETIH